MQNFRLLGVLVLVLVLHACKTELTGDRIDNLAPKTYLVTDKIERVGSDRFSSQVTISWWADDPDGFVVSYEWTFNDSTSNPWKRTNRTDSVFLLPMGANKDSADVIFRVRAIDNEGKKDQTGASLVFPIRNSAPQIGFLPIDNPPDTTFQFFSFGWSVTDLDGFSNIDKVQFAVNSKNGPWHDLERTISLVSFRVPNSGNASLFTGTTLRADTRTFPGFQLDAQNKFFLRAVDITGATSALDSTVWYVKRQRSRILAINDLIGPQRVTRFKIHTDSLRNLGLSDIDVIDFADGTKDLRTTALPSRIVPTAATMLADWDFIYWVSDDIERNITHASDWLKTFIADGGKMAVLIPVTKKLDDDNATLSYLSITQIQTSPVGSFRIPPVSSVTTPPTIGINPVAPFTGPRLSSTNPISNILPFYIAAGAQSIYTADFKIQRTGFPPPPIIDYPRVGDTVSTETVGVLNADKNILFFGMDLLLLNRDANNGRLLKRFCIDELGFRPN